MQHRRCRRGESPTLRSMRPRLPARPSILIPTAVKPEDWDNRVMARRSKSCLSQAFSTAASFSARRAKRRSQFGGDTELLWYGGQATTMGCRRVEPRTWPPPHRDSPSVPLARVQQPPRSDPQACTSGASTDTRKPIQEHNLIPILRHLGGGEEALRLRAPLLIL